MAINKSKNQSIQVTFPNADAENLKALQEALLKRGMDVRKSSILLIAFRNYLNILISNGLKINKQINEDELVEEPQKGE